MAINVKDMFFGTDNRNMKAEELVLEADRLGLRGSQTQQDLLKLLVGGLWDPGYIDTKGGSQYGLFGDVPKGPVFNLVQGGLQGEEGLSQQRLAIANQLLQNFGIDADAARQFGQQQLGLSTQSLQGQADLLQQQLTQANFNNTLQQSVGEGLGDFFRSGGAPSAAQQQNIGDIFNAQRQIGQSNLNQQFQDFARILNENIAPARGLRGTDTPIQQLGERTMQEFLRNAANLEAGISGSQAQALLQQPLSQTALGAGILNQLQGANLNTLNAFSVPIGQGFGQQQFVNQVGQFGLQFSPAAQTGPALTNFGALLGQGNFATPATAFSQGIAVNPAQTPGFFQRFGNEFSSSFGNELGKQAGKTSAMGMQGGIGGIGGSHPKYKTDIERMPQEDVDYVGTLERTPLYAWRYRQDPQRKRRIGGLTTDMPDVLVMPDREALDVMSYLGVLTGAIQQLSKKIEQLSVTQEEA